MSAKSEAQETKLHSARRLVRMLPTLSDVKIIELNWNANERHGNSAWFNVRAPLKDGHSPDLTGMVARYIGNARDGVHVSYKNYNPARGDATDILEKGARYEGIHVDGWGFSKHGHVQGLVESAWNTGQALASVEKNGISVEVSKLSPTGKTAEIKLSSAGQSSALLGAELGPLMGATPEHDGTFTLRFKEPATSIEGIQAAVVAKLNNSGVFYDPIREAATAPEKQKGKAGGNGDGGL